MAVYPLLKLKIPAQLVAFKRLILLPNYTYNSCNNDQATQDLSLKIIII